MKINITVVPGILKTFIGTIALFLVFFGIHWMAILAGVILGIVYFIIPKKYLN